MFVSKLDFYPVEIFLMQIIAAFSHNYVTVVQDGITFCSGCHQTRRPHAQAEDEDGS